MLGTAELEGLVARRRLPVVVTGFEPVELLRALLACVAQLERGRAAVANAYGRVVQTQGNPNARALLAEVFEPVDLAWRGIGGIAGGGLALRPAYAGLDAARRFALVPPAAPDPLDGVCISGAILRGRARPCDCPAFATACTPDHPLGAPMVSDEGACAAWYRYRR